MVVLSKRKVGALVGMAAAAATSLALATPASADTGARSGDIVIVGSDTLTNVANFLTDTAPGVQGGYNNLLQNHRAVEVDATGDANNRLAYDGTCGPINPTTGLGTFCDATTNQEPNALPSSVILRAGTKPVVRPNGSGAGVAALTADSTAGGYDGLATGSIQIARMSRLPNTTEENNCAPTSACGGLHVYQIATDTLGMAARATAFGGSNSPAGLSAQELVGIYQCTTTKWNQLPGNSGGSANTIHPLLPQSGSGTRTFFLADLQAANGGTAITLGSCVRTVEEHDPTGIYADPSPADAIEPFSKAKVQLINSGYFANGAGYSGTGFPQGAFTPGFINELSGTPGDSNPLYSSLHGVYMVIRNPDLTDPTPFQTGSTQNWASTLISTSTSFFARTNTAGPEIAAAGFTQAYKDCGVNPTTC